ncbi:ferritin-like domain-containing protein [Nocardioides sp.]|uniref:ferritin-like domain-containing protein n=1 Tax=Nocardioides sp. TaxID=35761 RepID=UPI0039E5724E
MTPEQTALAAEHAACYVYGVLAARTSQSDSPGLYGVLRSGFEHHRARRDRLTALIADAGQTPVPAEPAYQVPGRTGSPAGIRRAALTLERGCATTYAWLVAQTTGEDRRWAVEVLTETALRELSLKGSPQTLPGVD